MHSVPLALRGRCAAALLAILAISTVSAQLRIVNYNVAQLNGNTTRLGEVFAALADDDAPGWATAPHVYVFQEVNAADVATLAGLLNAHAPPGVTYAQATYTNDGEDCCAGAQACFYRTDMLTEQAPGHTDIFTQAGRFADRWRLRVLGYTGEQGRFYVYSAHLKAGNSGSDQADRDTGATAIRSNADNLPGDANILYCGDFNLSSNGEPAYATFLQPGPGRAVDPLGAGSWSGMGNAIKHTQSPRLTGGGLTGGGMDDRFDFQLVSEELHDAEGLAIIPGTYRAFGNDGAHYDEAINNGNNTYYPADIPRSNALADDLHAASDHIPVVAEYQIPAWMEAALPADFGRVIRDTPFSIDLHVWNAAPVLVPAGADELDYLAIATGGLSGGCGGSHQALSPPDVCPIAVDTSAPGPVSGAVQLTSASQGAANNSLLLETSGHVVRPAQASFDPAELVTSRVISRVVAPDTGAVGFDVDIHNHGFDADAALLDLDGVAGLTAPFTFDGGLANEIGAVPATLSFSFDTTAAGTADYVQNAVIDVSDEDIPGATASQLALTLQMFSRELSGDVNGDCQVNISDLGALLGAFDAQNGEAAYEPAADFNNDGGIDVSDLGALLVNFGQGC